MVFSAEMEFCWGDLLAVPASEPEDLEAEVTTASALEVFALLDTQLCSGA